MAKSRRRRHRTGAIVLKRLSGTGLGSMKNPKSAIGALIPPLVGGGLAALGAFGIEMLSEPKAGEMQTETQKFLHDYSAWLGVAVGGVGSLAMFALVGAPQGVAAAAGAVGVGASLGVKRLLDETSSAPVTAGRFGAVVPQAAPRLGAIVMSPVAGRRGRGVRGYQAMGPTAGEVVSLGALKSMNTSAFGTPGFVQGVR